jgi:hypothetical protein
MHKERIDTVCAESIAKAFITVNKQRRSNFLSQNVLSLNGLCYKLDIWITLSIIYYNAQLSFAHHLYNVTDQPNHCGGLVDRRLIDRHLADRRLADRTIHRQNISPIGPLAFICLRQHTILDMKYCVPAFTCVQSLWPSYV